MKNLNTEVYYTPYQLKLPLDYSLIIDADDPVCTFSEVMDHIDLSIYFAGKGCRMGRPKCDSVNTRNDGSIHLQELPPFHLGTFLQPLSQCVKELESSPFVSVHKGVFRGIKPQKHHGMRFVDLPDLAGEIFGEKHYRMQTPV